MAVEIALLVALIGVLMLLRQPVLVALGAAALFSYMVWNDGEAKYVVYDIWEAVNQEILLAIPLFILAAAIMSRGTIAKRLIDLAVEITRPVPGGLAIATVVSCAFFAAISGSATVTLLAVGSVMHKALTENGYSTEFSIGALCAGGVLGIIIPPSIPLILYGVMTDTSITDLFKAGLGPAAVMVGILAVFAMATNFSRRGDWTLSPASWIAALRRVSRASWRAVFALSVPVVMLGGIYQGVFTATEAAAVAVALALIVELVVHREMRPSEVWTVTMETAKLLGSLFPVLMFAVSLNILLTFEQAPQQIVALMETMIDNKWQFLIAANVLMLVVGMVIDIGSAVLILSPLLLPIARSYGIDPTHFGIIMIVNLGIGYLTPPMGLNLIVAMAAFREDFWTVCRGVLPFIVLMLAALAIVVLFPQITLFMVS